MDGKGRNDRWSDRLAPPVAQTDEGHTILDLDHYAPFLLNAVGNAWTRWTAALYREEFGLGITDWRVLAMLAIEPSITANRVCDVIRMDKAAASRALAVLAERELIVAAPGEKDPRQKRWRLTDDGSAVHDRIMAIALENEARLVAGIPADDLAVTLRSIRKMLENVPR